MHICIKDLTTVAGPMIAVIAVIMVLTPSMGNAQGGSCPSTVPEGMNWQPADPGTVFPDTPFYTGDGAPKTIKDYAGLGVVMNYWATWCAPCVREMPSLNTLEKDFAEPLGLAVLPISLDRGGARQADPFYKKNNLDALPVLIDDKRKMARAVGVSGLPTTIIIGRDGQELGRVLGEAHWHEEPLLGFLKACFGPA